MSGRLGRAGLHRLLPLLLRLGLPLRPVQVRRGLVAQVVDDGGRAQQVRVRLRLREHLPLRRRVGLVARLLLRLQPPACWAR